MECHPAQLALALVYPCEEIAEFISAKKLSSLLQQSGLHMPAELTENMAHQLNFEVRKQIIQPVKTISTARSEIILYWGTWGVTRSDEMQIKAWEKDIRYYVALHNNNKQEEYFLRLAFDTFSIEATYRVWIRHFLLAYQDDNLNTINNNILLNRDLIIQLADALADFYGVDQARKHIVSALFADTLNSKQIGHLAMEFPYYETNSIRLLQAALKVQFTCAPDEHNMLMLYGQLWQQISPESSQYEHISNSKSLLHKFGISLTERKRLLHLGTDEMYFLCLTFPSKQDIARSYLYEIHKMLQQREQLQRIGKQHALFRISSKIADIILLIAHLRQMESAGDTRIPNIRLRTMIPQLHFTPDAENGVIKASNNEPLPNVRSTPLKSVIQLLELYRNMQFTTQATQQESVDDAYMVDPLELVTDWFLTTNPILDKQRKRLGWKHLVKLATHWHANNGNEYDWVLDYPAWSCIVASHYTEWGHILPPDLPYHLLPLTTPTQLIEESTAMHHCVASYVEDCVTGGVRIFSIREAESGLRIATAELRESCNRWRVVQLKGKYNEEMILRIHADNDPMSILAKALADFYNRQHG